MMTPYARSPRAPRKQGVFKEFDATELFCPRCRRAVPVRKRLLLVLPEGDKYEYLCAVCSSTVGTKISRDQPPMKLII
jgi:DNA-directed RNA polymerase subunit RPC12/RpoP